MKIDDLRKLKVCWEIPYHKTWHGDGRDRLIKECGMTDEVKSGSKMFFGRQTMKATFLYITMEKKPQVGVVTFQRRRTPESERRKYGKYTHWQTDYVLEDSGITPYRLQSCMSKNPEQYSNDLCDYLVAEIKEKVDSR